jgi:hypothetical protein
MLYRYVEMGCQSNWHHSYNGARMLAKNKIPHHALCRGVAYVVVIASASRTEDPGFESRQGVRFLGINTLQCCCQNLKCIVIVCVRETNASKNMNLIFLNTLFASYRYSCRGRFENVELEKNLNGQGLSCWEINARWRCEFFAEQSSTVEHKCHPPPHLETIVNIA